MQLRDPAGYTENHCPPFSSLGEEEEEEEDPLTHAGTGRHCRTCKARGRTRVWPVDRSSRSRRSRRQPTPPFVLPILPFNRTKTSSARRDDSRGMNTVVQGLAEVPGSFLPSCPHVSTSEATCQRKENIGIFPNSFFPIIPRCFLRHVESWPKESLSRWIKTYIEILGGD